MSIISVYSGETVTFEGLNITNGDAGGNSGGGIFVNQSVVVVVVDCIFDHNAAYNGGAINSNSYELSFINCEFTSNSASNYGGAVYSTMYSPSPESSSSFTNCGFNFNTAYRGGAIYCTVSSSTFTNCTFTFNSVIHYGGAVYTYSNYCSSTFTNCKFISNSSAYYGGAVYCSVTSSSFTNCTLTLNEATEQGGAIWCYTPLIPENPIIIKNCILWDNTAHEGSQIYEKEKPLLITYSNIQGGYTDTGNIDADPLFVDPDNDFHLQLSSPCIDTGTADGAPSDDLDGYIRPIGNGDDMGSYEYHYDILFWQGYSDDWNDNLNWQPGMVPVEFNAVVFSQLPSEREWPVIDDSNSVAAKVLIESGTLMIDKGKLVVGGS